MTILSVDFDFFQNIPRNVLNCYPDGIDLPLALSNLAWSEKYTHHSEELSQVEFDESNFEILTKIINNQSTSTPVYIASSHVKAYDFSCKMQDSHDLERVHLVNVDLHHDLINENKKIDCGNWIGALLKEKRIGYFQWIAKPLSQEVYGLSNEEMRKFHASFKFSAILNCSFDAIFVCKSIPWLLPSFDNKFSDLVELCENHFQSGNLLIEGSTKTIRDIN